MTLVTFDLQAVAASGRVPVDARVRWQPTTRRTDGGVVILPETHGVKLVDGLASADLDEGYYLFTEASPAGATALRYVPAVGPVSYAALPAIDPATMAPTAEPEAAWFAALTSLEAVAQDAATDAAASRAAAEGSQGSAAGSAATAGNHATAAAGSATAAAGSATTAGNHAAAAAGSATTAAGHVTSAAQEVTKAAGHATTAGGHATAAAGSASSAQAFRDQAAGSASSAESTRTSMVVGGAVDDLTGHLFLERVAQAPVDAGYVVGPPVSVTIGEVETGPETPGTPGPQGLTGPKGDPGGLVDGTALGASDLNNIMTSGVYLQTQAAEATAIRNYPVTRSGHLLVFRQSSVVMEQVYYTNGFAGQATQGVFMRSLSGTTWSPWVQMATQRVDQSAGRAIYTHDYLNNREQLVYGDTGWREVAVTPVAGKVVSGSVRYRRRGGAVELRFIDVLLDVANNGFTDIILSADVPAGFRPAAGVRNMQAIGLQNNATNQQWITIYGSIGWTHTITSGVYSAARPAVPLLGTVTWNTDDSWPLTLPGTAAGAIPNL